MTIDETDKLAFALLAAIRWAVDGGKLEELPKVHEELSGALVLFGQKKVGKRSKHTAIMEAYKRHGENVQDAAAELGISRETVYRHLRQQA